MLKFHIITLFEDACNTYLSTSIIGRARKRKKILISYQNPRNFVSNKWGKVDERPYGGGPGMVIQALPIVKAIEKILKIDGRQSPTTRSKGKTKIVIWLSPASKQFTNRDADLLAKYNDIILVCGRYEGIDERAKKIVRKLAVVKEFAVGEAVYSGGEIPALAIIDAITRRLPGVLGKDSSVEERRIASSTVYTRPEMIEYKKKKYHVPKVLKTGHHAHINSWRRER